MNEPYFQAIYQIVVTGHWITDQMSREFKELGFTEPQYNVLRILRGAKGKPIAVQDIQSRMIQKSSNVTRIIDKLLKKNCVQRKECSYNRRKMDIIITPNGLEILKKLDVKLNTFHQSYYDNLTETELETLKQLILKLKNND